MLFGCALIASACASSAWPAIDLAALPDGDAHPEAGGVILLDEEIAAAVSASAEDGSVRITRSSSATAGVDPKTRYAEIREVVRLDSSVRKELVVLEKIAP